DIGGVYAWDSDKKMVDGVLISHPHIDHYGFFRYLKKDICFYLGEATKKIINLTVIFTPIRGSISNYHPIESGKSFSCGDFRITPYLMDHSAFDSYAFLVEADGKSLIYSGDFREHGRKPGVFRWFLEHAPEDIDVLLLEGTVLDRGLKGKGVGEFKSETEIEAETVRLLKAGKNMTLLYFSAQNIDRLVSFYRASLKTGKIFAIDFYTANILGCLKDYGEIPYPSENYPNIKVFFPYWLCRRITRHGREKLMYRYKDYKITREEISDRSGEIMMVVRPSMLKDLGLIKNIEEATFIYSLWEGYLQDYSMQKMMRFIKKKNMKFYQVHTSGHAEIDTLKKVVKKLKPGKIVPIHTFHPDKYSGLFDRKIEQVSDGEVFVV
ncbi:MBL fold metallo-hydrolase, partial [bacterium]|nr:MBL fold metallo-hydrolase [bacterium]